MEAWQGQLHLAQGRSDAIRTEGCTLAAGHGEGGEADADVAAPLELVNDGARALLNHDGAPAAKVRR
jgi:hypothetical protein